MYEPSGPKHVSLSSTLNHHASLHLFNYGKYGYPGHPCGAPLQLLLPCFLVFKVTSPPCLNVVYTAHVWFLLGVQAAPCTKMGIGRYPTLKFGKPADFKFADHDALAVLQNHSPALEDLVKFVEVETEKLGYKPK